MDREEGMKIKKSKHKHRVEQNVQMSRHDDDTKPSEKPTDNVSKHHSTCLRLQISEDAKGELSVEWVAVFKGTDVAVPMRYSHIIGKLEAAKFILYKTFYGMEAPEVSRTPKQG